MDLPAAAGPKIDAVKRRCWEGPAVPVTDEDQLACTERSPHLRPQLEGSRGGVVPERLGTTLHAEPGVQLSDCGASALV